MYSPSEPFATALLIHDGVIAWIGEDTAAQVHRDDVDAVIDVRGRVIAPAFVDAHIHATSTGLTLEGLDLTAVRSRRELLDSLAEYCQRGKGASGDVVMGHGWDDTTWIGDHVDRTPPTRSELDAASAGRFVYLSRIDVHSALVTSSLASLAPHSASLDGFDPVGPVSRQAHSAVRDAALASITSGQRARAHRLVRATAAAAGIACLQENAGPAISSEQDLRELLEGARTEPGTHVYGYWAQLASDGGIERARDLGALGVAGDLFVDGALGSRTACLCRDYSDTPGTRGAGYLDIEVIADHVVAATRAGMQAGFHVIGDAACASVTHGFLKAADVVGIPALRSSGHRIEHAEMLSDTDIEVLRSLGITASMQPQFDLLWGGESGMYQQRLGSDRRRRMNRFADLLNAGVALAFSSDSPVTPMEPWASVRAAAWHHEPRQRISVRAAFAASTRGGWRAMRRFDSGVLTPGAPAHIAVWDAEELDVQVPDTRVTAWSTDPRSATPALPVLHPDLALPRCDATFVDGRLAFASGAIDGLDRLDGREALSC